MDNLKFSHEEYLEALENVKILKSKMFDLRKTMGLNKRNEDVYNKLTEELIKVKKELTKKLAVINLYENDIMEKGEDKNDKYKRK